MFGSIAAVSHYNILSRIVAAMVCQLLGIRLVSYVGDFGALIPAFLGKNAIASFAKFCALLGIKLKLAKSKIGTRVTFLGLEGFFPSPPNGMTLLAQLAQEKASRRIDTAKLFLSAGRVGHKE